MNKITTSINEFNLDAQGILHVKILDDVEITLEKVKEDYETVLQHFGEGKFLVLVDSQNSFSITTEAREYSQQEVIDKFHIATAVVGNNEVSRIIINMLARINRPSTPFKMFADKEKATEWLLQQAEQNQEV